LREAGGHNILKQDHLSKNPVRVRDGSALLLQYYPKHSFLVLIFASLTFHAIFQIVYRQSKSRVLICFLYIATSKKTCRLASCLQITYLLVRNGFCGLLAWEYGRRFLSTGSLWIGELSSPDGAFFPARSRLNVYPRFCSCSRICK